MFGGEGTAVGSLEDERSDASSAATPDEVVGLFECADAAHRAVGRAQLELLWAIERIDRCEGWAYDGARDLSHWVSMRYGISAWKAERWVTAARRLSSLPRVAEALGSGELGVDKAVELTRLATPATEEGLVWWARTVAPGTIRHRGNLEARREHGGAEDLERERSVRWWYEDDGRRFGLQALLPASSGAVVARALEREASNVPTLPADRDHPEPREVRLADALVAICSGRLSSDPDPDRATVVIHAPLAALHGEQDAAPSGEVEGPGAGDAVVPAATVRRLVCDGRVQLVAEDLRGEVLSLGRLTRTPSASQVRLVRARDRGCVFPGCGTRRFTQAHHVVFWSAGGKTDLENLALVCWFHHRLVHEHGWKLTRDGGRVRWFRPDGVCYRAGPRPP